MKVRWALSALLCAVLYAPVGAQVANDVPRDHFAYEAIQDLVSKGLVKGYPPESNFWGKRTATRYEMAALVQRVLARLEEALAQKAAKTDIPKIPDATPPPPTVKPEDLKEIQDLVSAFKVELSVIGTDMQKVKDMIGDLNARIDGLEGKVTKAVGDTEEVKKDLGDLKTEFGEVKETVGLARQDLDSLSKDFKARKLSGYIQSRFEAFDYLGSRALFPDQPGTSSSAVTGVSQGSGGPAVGGPSYGFQVRRARLKFGGPMTQRSDFAIQLDVPSSGSVALKDAFINITDLPLPDKSSLMVGLFPPQFGVELPASDAVLEEPDRAAGFSDSTASLVMFKTPSSTNVNAGKPTGGAVLPLFLGQDRDMGAALTVALPNIINPASKFTLGVFNGEGRAAGGVKNQNNALDTVARFSTSLDRGHLDLGVSGYYGTLSVRGQVADLDGSGNVTKSYPYATALRAMLGGDAQFISPWKTVFRAEYMGGLFEASPDRAVLMKGNHAQAWYVLAKHPINKRLDLCAKYDEFMPITQAGVTYGSIGGTQLGRSNYIRRTLGIGALYYLDDATRLRLWYSKGLTPYDPTAAVGSPNHSNLGLITTEVQISY